MFEQLYDVSEQTNVHFVGFITDRARYDFSIVFTNQFFGKPLVICMQTGKSTLFCLEDLSNLDDLQQAFLLQDPKAAEELQSFLMSRLPSLDVRDQY
ncbi:DUF3055 domain-containing protein [Paenibacillus abyssi]|uniref:DUF3055 domain-containing protein n=1 Tax=Paenibacillus abyssi TaxID=1340531 RepID=A0A917D273_9BACL|nr:DUF3055 domain-containing protein [Paenibacillus abyssi]GGG09539.1 hypothetical protein GCM10010916_27990 [Paenibacillus abyssi]